MVLVDPGYNLEGAGVGLVLWINDDRMYDMELLINGRTMSVYYSEVRVISGVDQGGR